MPSVPEVGVGPVLRGLREARGLTQEKLGELSGVHATNIGRIERAEADPTLGTLVDLALALGLEPDHLIKVKIPSGLKLTIAPAPAGTEPGRLVLEPILGLASRSELRYVVVIQRTRDGYTASVPDLPGCAASGATKQAAEAAMLKAGNDHVQGLRKAGRPIPPPEAYAVALTFLTRPGEG